jgi:hypothetical protein
MVKMADLVTDNWTEVCNLLKPVEAAALEKENGNGN